jgi:hypothetical protein
MGTEPGLVIQVLKSFYRIVLHFLLLAFTFSFLILRLSPEVLEILCIVGDTEDMSNFGSTVTCHELGRCQEEHVQ